MRTRSMLQDSLWRTGLGARTLQGRDEPSRREGKPEMSTPLLSRSTLGGEGALRASPSLEELAELPARIARLEAALTELHEKVQVLDPGGAPLTVPQFCERFGWSENQLRWLLFNRDENGLAEAVSGRGRLLIDVPRFFEILQREKAGKRRR